MPLEIYSVALASQHGHSPCLSTLEDTVLGFLGISQATALLSPLQTDLEAAASMMVLQTARSHISKAISDLRGRGQDQATQEVLRTAVNLAKVELSAFSIRKRQKMECTLDLALVLDGMLYVCHLGDGATFLLRKGLAHKLTQDHISQAPDHGSKRPGRKQALGIEGSEAEILAVTLGRSDRILLTSPWLTSNIDDVNLLQATTDPSPDGMTARLISIARDRSPHSDMAAGVILPKGIQTSTRRPGTGRLETLARTPLFAYCTERELISLAGITRPAQFNQGQTLFTQGEHGQAMYILVAGKLKVERDGQAIANLEPGVNFGEMALLDQPERSATITATEPAEALIITRQAFFSLLKRDPTLAVKVLWNMLMRLSSNLRSTSEKLAALERALK